MASLSTRLQAILDMWREFERQDRMGRLPAAEARRADAADIAPVAVEVASLEARLAAAEAALAKADARWREVIRARHIKVDVSHNAYGEGISECGWCGGIWRTVGDDEADGHDDGCPAAPVEPPHA